MYAPLSLPLLISLLASAAAVAADNLALPPAPDASPNASSNVPASALQTSLCPSNEPSTAFPRVSATCAKLEPVRPMGDRQLYQVQIANYNYDMPCGQGLLDNLRGVCEGGLKLRKLQQERVKDFDCKATVSHLGEPYLDFAIETTFTTGPGCSRDMVKQALNLSSGDRFKNVTCS